MGTSEAVACPACGVTAADDEKFCSACGGALASDAVRPDAALAEAGQAKRASAIKRARKWLLVVSILTVVTGLVFYAIQNSDVEKQIREAERATAGIDPAVRDAAMMEKIGMTFDQAIEHDRGQVKLLLLINFGLAAMYLVMWWWARKNPLGATVTAFMLFVTVIVVNAVLDPKTIPQGILVKVIFIAALAKAIQAASEDRRLTSATT